VVQTGFGCIDTACINIILSATENPPLDNLRIFPIPSKGTWVINLPNTSDLPVDWILYDIHGRLLESGRLEGLSSIISLENVPAAGMYYMQLKNSKNQIRIAKVLIQ
jgi:hypothetical protein